MGDTVRLEALIDLMIRKRVIRIQMPDTTEVELHSSAFTAPASAERHRIQMPDTTEVELHSSAFTAPASAERQEPSAEATDRCVCGHSLRVEHNEMGCLLGCANSLCTGEQEARA